MIVGANFAVLSIMFVYTLKCTKNFGLGLIDFEELEGATKRSGSGDSAGSHSLSVLMKV